MSNIIDIEFLFKEYYKRLFHVAYNVLHDESVADDIVQEVFIHIWNKREELNIKTTIEGYLVKSTVNRSINYLEKNKRNLKLEIHEGMEYELSDFSNESNNFDYELFQKEVYKELDKLPPKCKAIFVLSRFENMKNREISEHLGVSIKTVENQMTIAISKLNSGLKPKIKKNFPDLFLNCLIFLSCFWG